MTRTATPIVKRFCKRKQTMCEYANELAYCKVTACVYPIRAIDIEEVTKDEAERLSKERC